MLSKIATFYAKRNKRERVMLWCILFCAMFAWLSSQIKCGSRLNGEIAELTSKIKLAKSVVGQAPVIEKELNDILETFDTSKTLTSAALQIAVEERAMKASLDYSLSSVSTKEVGRFKINSISLSARRGQLKNLAAFEWEMRSLEPYIMFSRATFEGVASGEVSAKYEISAVE